MEEGEDCANLYLLRASIVLAINSMVAGTNNFQLPHESIIVKPIFPFPVLILWRIY